MGAEGSRVKVFPKDVEGDAPFDLRLIHLVRLSSSPCGLLTLPGDDERQRLVDSSVCACFHTCFFFFLNVIIIHVSPWEKKCDRRMRNSTG